LKAIWEGGDPCIVPDEEIGGGFRAEEDVWREGREGGIDVELASGGGGMEGRSKG
jgi:hypothetical protein